MTTQGGQGARGRVHFIGVGGTGMSGLMRVVAARDWVVSGSDIVESSRTRALREDGFDVWTDGPRPDEATLADIVVHSAAVPDTDPERRAVEKAGIEVMTYAGALARAARVRHTVAVAGTHGKTTTASMLAWILHSAGKDPGWLIGGDVAQLGHSAKDGDPFVVEACEYARNFLHLHPNLAVITNVEEDHLDCYDDLQAVRDAFLQFGRRVQPGGGMIMPSEVAEWLSPQLPDVKIEVLDPDDSSIPPLLVPGRHARLDAHLALRAARQLGVGRTQAWEALAKFRGAGRRFEIVLGGQEGSGVALVDDYAHHPTEIDATLQAAGEAWPGSRLLMVYQPHQHFRTLAFKRPLAVALSRASRLFLAPIYRARDPEHVVATIASEDLAREAQLLGGAGTDARAWGTARDACQAAVDEARRGDVILVVGAGDIGDEVEWMRQALASDAAVRVRDVDA